MFVGFVYSPLAQVLFGLCEFMLRCISLSFLRFFFLFFFPCFRFGLLIVSMLHVIDGG